MTGPARGPHRPPAQVLCNFLTLTRLNFWPCGCLRNRRESWIYFQLADSTVPFPGTPQSALVQTRQHSRKVAQDTGPRDISDGPDDGGSGCTCDLRLRLRLRQRPGLSVACSSGVREGRVGIPFGGEGAAPVHSIATRYSSSATDVGTCSALRCALLWAASRRDVGTQI